MVPFGLPRSWRISTKRPYQSVREARADMFVNVNLQEDAEDEEEGSQVDTEDQPTDEDIPWLKQLARIQFLASGELSEDTWFLHLPHQLQTTVYYRKIWDAQKEMCRTLCTDKTLALVMFVLRSSDSS